MQGTVLSARQPPLPLSLPSPPQPLPLPSPTPTPTLAMEIVLKGSVYIALVQITLKNKKINSFNKLGRGKDGIFLKIHKPENCQECSSSLIDLKTNLHQQT